MYMPSFLQDFLTYTVSPEARKELTEWLESNSATVIVDQLRQFIERPKE